MSICIRFCIVAWTILLPAVVFPQGSTSSAKYDDVITKAYGYLELIRNKNKKELLKAFEVSGFQDKKEFKHFLSSKNLDWAQSVIDAKGMPPRGEVSVSEWRTVTNDSLYKGQKINLTFFFKAADEKFSHINDHVSMDFEMGKDGVYRLDGLMFFKKDDYVVVKTILEDMP